jgi:hypothetical protein
MTSSALVNIMTRYGKEVDGIKAKIENRQETFIDEKLIRSYKRDWLICSAGTK